MLSYLKQHPFAVEAFFENSTVLSFFYPKEVLAPLLPDCLQLDLFENKWAFIAVAVVKTKNMRPKGLPKYFGRDFILIGYRIFVRYTTSSGQRRRGLYILKSETNSRTLQTMGNILTRYNYSYNQIDISQSSESLSIFAKPSDLSIQVNRSDTEPELPPQSPFSTWREARKFAGPMPYTFSYDKRSKKVTSVEGVRSNWKPRPIDIYSHQIPYLSELGIGEAKLANAFMVENIPYQWKRGELDTWNHH